MASVGVCTRPTGVSWKPPVLLLNAVMARVPLMPTSQSLSDRQTAAFASGTISSSRRKCSNASRIDSRVIDCSQRRRIGLLRPPYFTMFLKINSPSRPASQALIKSLTSLRFAKRRSIFSRSSVFSFGFSENSSGMIGKFAKLHFPRFTSNSLGRQSSTKCPTADEMT